MSPASVIDGLNDAYFLLVSLNYSESPLSLSLKIRDDYVYNKVSGTNADIKNHRNSASGIN